MAAASNDLRFQQLEARLSCVEAALRNLELSRQSAGELETKFAARCQDGQSVSSGELLASQSEVFETAVFTSTGDEMRAGIVTPGPCYELQHSVWDACLCIGLPALSKWDSFIATLLVLLNIATQMGFVAVVQMHMLEDVLKPDQLNQLLRFRADVAHDVKYADLGGGRSLARRVCSQDDSLQLANAQTGLVTDLYNYSTIGPVLALLAIGCWLMTTLREIFDILGFIGAVQTYPVGETTQLSTEVGEEDAVEKAATISQISHSRKDMLFALVIVPRFVVAAVLMVTGTRYLANTLSLADLILNAVALAFIFDLDELIESAFMPRRARFLLDKLSTLPISQPRIPGLGHVNAGLLDRARNFIKLALLLVGLMLSWYLLLQPLQNTTQLALNILCSGRQDFIYAVNAATGIIEAVPTFSEEAPLTFSTEQRSVLELANLDLYHMEGLYPEAMSMGQIRDFDDTPVLQKIQQVLLLERSDVAAAADNLPCTDSAFAENLVRPRLRSVTDNRVDSCTALALQNDLCAKYNLSSVRALCPQTCGCDDPLEPAAGAFATVPFGCPKRCSPVRDNSARLRHAPCEDWTVNELVESEYVKRYLTGAFSINFISDETLSASVLLYTETLKRRFFHLLPGPNKTESLKKAGGYYASGGWHRDVIAGKFELGLGIPHPRGLEGCPFLNSREVVELAGGSICTPRAELDMFVSLRPQCPVTCGCHADQQECPGTCPLI